MDRVLITPRSLTSAPPPALDRLSDAGFDLVHSTPGVLPTEAELLRLVPGCVGWLAGIEPVSERVINAATDLRVVSRNGTGVDNLPLESLERRGIVVAKADGANAIGVAELTVGLILAAVRHLPETSNGIKAGGWPRLPGREVSGACVGVVGCGAVGRRVCAVLSGMGANVVAYDPFEPDLGSLANEVRYVTLEALIATAGIISLHCPPIADRALLDQDALSRMQPETVLINTARESLVDQDALLKALDAGHIAAYATDVFEEEPPVNRSIANHPRVIATSHIGGLTAESIARATESAVDNLLTVLNR
ncbi:MAG: oxidoreductase [Hyphomicrobiales bacterium]|nr:oxidoreductase [Hyphomicrobiales bacterium]